MTAEEIAGLAFGDIVTVPGSHDKYVIEVVRGPIQGRVVLLQNVRDGRRDWFTAADMDNDSVLLKEKKHDRTRH